MSVEQAPNGIEVRDAETRTSISAAKARLLNWADESDVRTRRMWSRMGTIATGGAVAAVGALVIVRIIAPGRRSDAHSSRIKRMGRGLMSWALIARTGRWLLPYVIRAVSDNRVDRAQTLETFPARNRD